MNNKEINLATVAQVAEALKHIKEQVVFVGGAVVSLYADDPAADEIRPTQDRPSLHKQGKCLMSFAVSF